MGQLPALKGRSRGRFSTQSSLRTAENAESEKIWSTHCEPCALAASPAQRNPCLGLCEEFKSKGLKLFATQANND